MKDSDFGARLRHIRNNILDLTLEKLGEELGIGKSQLSQVESGKAKLGPKPLLKLIESYKDRFDVRYLFGQMDNADMADLRKNLGAATTDNVLQTLKEQQKQIIELSSLVSNRVRASSDVTNEAQHVDADLVLRNLVRKILNLRRPLWSKLDGFIDGMNAIVDETEARSPDQREAGRQAG